MATLQLNSEIRTYLCRKRTTRTSCFSAGSSPLRRPFLHREGVIDEHCLSYRTAVIFLTNTQASSRFPLSSPNLAYLVRLAVFLLPSLDNNFESTRILSSFTLFRFLSLTLSLSLSLFCTVPSILPNRDCIRLFLIDTFQSSLAQPIKMSAISAIRSLTQLIAGRSLLSVNTAQTCRISALHSSPVSFGVPF
jgi:hypothetical protein